MQRSPQDDQWHRERRITAGGKEVSATRAFVDVSEDPVKIQMGSVDMTIPAKTFSWTVDQGDDLQKALRPHIHDVLKNLPGHHFLAIEPVYGISDGSVGLLQGLKITVIVPETRG